MNKAIKQAFVKISVLENSIEAQLIESVLGEQNIPHRVQSFHDTAYDGLFQFQKGWGAIWAPKVHKNTILEILENLRSGKRTKPMNPADH
jgi:outer membrane protein assembly factor BamE (lipoprotein component of BamABCDE complex)